MCLIFLGITYTWLRDKDVGSRGGVLSAAFFFYSELKKELANIIWLSIRGNITNMVEKYVSAFSSARHLILSRKYLEFILLTLITLLVCNLLTFPWKILMKKINKCIINLPYVHDTLVRIGVYSFFPYKFMQSWLMPSKGSIFSFIFWSLQIIACRNTCIMFHDIDVLSFIFYIFQYHYC